MTKMLLLIVCGHQLLIFVQFYKLNLNLLHLNFQGAQPYPSEQFVRKVTTEVSDKQY